MTTKPFEPHVVTLDAQCLREGGWPHPNAKLQQLVELVKRFGIHVWIAEGAVSEVRGHRERTAREAVTRLHHAAEAVRRAGLATDISTQDVDSLMGKVGRRPRAVANGVRHHAHSPY